MAEFVQERNQRRGSARIADRLVDEEQASRVAQDREAQEYDDLERRANQRKADQAVDLEQQRRVQEDAEFTRKDEAERVRNGQLADQAFEGERERRLAEDRAVDEAAAKERGDNRRKSIRLMEEEQKTRVSESHGRRPSATLLQVQGELTALPIRPDDAEAATSDTYQVSSTASKNVAALLATDAGDESLRRYKEQLLGAAAHGDLGDIHDPRRVVVTEFRVMFEGAPDVVFHLDTAAGVNDLQTRGFTIKENANYKFHIAFRVQHEIVTGLKFVNKVKKGIVSQTEELVIGSYPPQSAPHVFEFPRHGWLTAPSGMLMRGSYRSHDKFIDIDGNLHLEYEYGFQIKKDW